MMWLKIMLTQAAFAATIAPTPFPVFLKQGFSTILEFEEAPTQVVLGDSKAFQVEKLERSIVVKPMVPYAVTNMFVYFKTKEPRMFVLSAAEDVEPTYYKKFESLKSSVPVENKTYTRSETQGKTRLINASFDKKRDFLTVDVVIHANSTAKMAPNWDLVRAKYKSSTLVPLKLWSERREALRDSSIKARFVFAKPDVPANLKGVSVVVPIKGSAQAVTFQLGGRS